jgi:hypothetical protein
MEDIRWMGARGGKGRMQRHGEGKESTHKHLPSSLGAIHNPKNKTIFGCRHSAIILHSLSKYFITFDQLFFLDTLIMSDF